MLEAVGDETSALRADALTGAANLAFMQGDLRAAASHQSASLELQREIRDPQGVAYAANNLANTWIQLGDNVRGARALRGNALDRQRARRRARRGLRVDQPGRSRGPGRRPRSRSIARGGDPRVHPAAWRSLDGGIRARRVRANGASGRPARAGAGTPHRSPGHPRGARRSAWRRAGADAAGGAGAGRRTMVAALAACSARAWRSGRNSATCPGSPARWRAWPAPSRRRIRRQRPAWMALPTSLRESIRAIVPPRVAAAHDQRLADLEARLGSDRFERARREGRLMTPNEALATLPL